MKLDHDEKRIEQAFTPFSTMEVDTENLLRKVDENMKNNFVSRAPKKRLGLVLAATVTLMVLMAGTLYAAVGLGVFDRFLNQHGDMPFVEAVSPVEEYMLVDGFRVDIIAAGKFDNQGIIYVSIQDVSGQGRLTENATITHHWPLGGMSEMIYFDTENNLAHFELGVNAMWALEIADGETLDYIDVGYVKLMFDWYSPFSEALALDLSSLEMADVMPVPAFPWAGRDGQVHHQMLVPSGAGAFPELPYSNGHQWISGMAIIDGYFHFQLGQRVVRSDSAQVGVCNSGRMGWPVLINPAGEESRAQFCQDTREGWLPDWVSDTAHLFTDENLQPVEPSYSFYSFEERVFRVDVDNLDAYTLILEGMFTPKSTDFNLGLRIYADDSPPRIVGYSGLFGDIHLNNIVLSQRSIRLEGRVDGHDGMESAGAAGWVAGDDAELYGIFNELGDVYLETPYDIMPFTMPLYSTRVVRVNETAPVTILFISATPIDVDAATAIIIDGTRIELN
ncbi:MAG: hypothetical protein FWC78_06655 [Defluviitaleaceae bacterium]|nr:hypothetical protein [Defluviitaleaceae bacterium]